MLWEHPVCRGCLRQRRHARIDRLLARVRAGLDALDPEWFLMVDAPDGYGYRRLPLSTFDPDLHDADDEDDPGVTFPWPPGEVHTVARIFHLAGVEAMPLVAIAQACRVTKLQVRAILANALYTRIGVLDEDPVSGQVIRLTPVSPALFQLCHQQAQVASWSVPALLRHADSATR